MYSDDLRKFRHNFTDSKCTEDNDVRLSSIDPNYSEENEMWYHRYTPDMYNPTSGCLLELGTVNSPYADTVMDQFTLKKKRYQEAAMHLKVPHVYVLACGPNYLCTDLPINQKFADEMCNRVRFGLSVEDAIIEMTGEDIFRGNENLQINNQVEEVLSKIIAPTKVTLNYDPDLLRSFRNPMSEESYDHT